MEALGLLRIEGPFPFAMAIVAISSDSVAMRGDCFVFIQNGRNFIGFQRIKMPGGLPSGEAHLRMNQVVRRVHDKMAVAAERKGRLQSGTSVTDFVLADAQLDLVSDLWGPRGFAEILDWVGKTTASALLRAEIDQCRLHGGKTAN